MVTAILVLCCFILIAIAVSAAMRVRVDRQRTMVLRADALSFKELLRIEENMRLLLHDLRDVVAVLKGWSNLVELQKQIADRATGAMADAAKKIETVAKTVDSKTG